MTVQVIAFASNGDRPGRRIHFWCPACEDAHGITVEAPGSWTWDGNEASPTFDPSVKVTGVQWPVDQAFYKPAHHVEPGEVIVCHSYVRAGRIEFLGDCTHELRGQVVDLPPWPYGDED